jgi:uncharacterized membrane protein (UPF0127 family)
MNAKDFYIQTSTSEIVHIRLEIASTQNERTFGLMERTYLPDKYGMLFIYSEPTYPSLWMKNTYIPLDILFINENGTIQCIKHGKPLDLTNITCSYDLPSKYVIELLYGTCKKYNIKEGDKLIFTKVERFLL